MLFNSVDFFIFLPVVFSLYWLIGHKKPRLQNLWIIAVSYFFYGWWDWRFLSLILISTAVDYSLCRGLSGQENTSKRKALLWASVIVNLGILGFFKYYNFFLDNFLLAFSLFGKEIQANSLNILLPVGISFYTFQTLSYTIDVYKKKIEPTRDFVAFAAFVCFFPQLVAGPIERASNLLPQFLSKRNFQYARAVDGLRQILWGLLKKIVIADNCAEFANQIFNNSAEMNGSALVLGAIFFTLQIYGDFSGYTDIAIGTSRLFGFELRRNFAFPYFSRDIAEFWRRWHISLSTWFRDYLYIPLGGSRGRTWKKIRNTFAIFIVSGFWHGANWTFIIWGAINAIYFLPLLLTGSNRHHLDIVAQGKFWPSPGELLNMAKTFCMTALAWTFFRAENLTHAMNYLQGMWSSTLFSIPTIQNMRGAFTAIVLATLFMSIEWCGRENKYGFQKIGHKWPRPARWILYSFLIFTIGMFMPTDETPFIYFQF